MTPNGRRVSNRVARAAGFLCLSLSSCQLGEKESIQVGFRGVAKEVNFDVSALNAALVSNRVPPPLPPAGPSPPGNWQNVQVLTDISANEFNRTMLAITQWVSPQQGCGYCHNLANFAADSLNGKPIYTKIVSRTMLRMNRDINRNWNEHVAYTGVTCYTCHRGNPLPNGLWWYTDEDQYLRYYLDRPDARIQSRTVSGTPVNRTSLKQAAWTYAVMNSQSRALGVNCTYCHNSRQWSSWTQSSPTRVIAMYGAQMTRYLNVNYLLPLQPVYPEYRLGPMGDAPKMQCVTCHNGVYKPLFGVSMVKDYPALWGGPTWDSTLAVVHEDTLSDSVRTATPLDSATGGMLREVLPPLPAPTPRPPVVRSSSAPTLPRDAVHGSVSMRVRPADPRN